MSRADKILIYFKGQAMTPEAARIWANQMSPPERKRWLVQIKEKEDHIFSQLRDEYTLEEVREFPL